jgi:soluble lytic murein transglycosylase-like protein
MGLMQLMPSVAREYGVRNAYDPKSNVEAGVQKLKTLLEKYGAEGVNLALAAYNAGEGAVAKFNGVPPYRETQGYVTRILALAGLTQ